MAIVFNPDDEEIPTKCRVLGLARTIPNPEFTAKTVAELDAVKHQVAQWRQQAQHNRQLIDGADQFDPDTFTAMYNQQMTLIEELEPYTYAFKFDASSLVRRHEIALYREAILKRVPEAVATHSTIQELLDIYNEKQFELFPASRQTINLSFAEVVKVIEDGTYDADLHGEFDNLIDAHLDPTTLEYFEQSIVPTVGSAELVAELRKGLQARAFDDAGRIEQETILRAPRYETSAAKYQDAFASLAELVDLLERGDPSDDELDRKFTEAKWAIFRCVFRARALFIEQEIRIYEQDTVEKLDCRTVQVPARYEREVHSRKTLDLEVEVVPLTPLDNDPSFSESTFLFEWTRTAETETVVRLVEKTTPADYLTLSDVAHPLPPHATGIYTVRVYQRWGQRRATYKLQNKAVVRVLGTCPRDGVKFVVGSHRTFGECRISASGTSVDHVKLLEEHPDVIMMVRRLGLKVPLLFGGDAMVDGMIRAQDGTVLRSTAMLLQAAGMGKEKLISEFFSYNAVCERLSAVVEQGVRDTLPHAATALLDWWRSQHSNLFLGACLAATMKVPSDVLRGILSRPGKWETHFREARPNFPPIEVTRVFNRSKTPSQVPIVMLLQHLLTVDGMSVARASLGDSYLRFLGSLYQKLCSIRPKFSSEMLWVTAPKDQLLARLSTNYFVDHLGLVRFQEKVARIVKDRSINPQIYERMMGMRNDPNRVYHGDPHAGEYHGTHSFATSDQIELAKLTMENGVPVYVRGFEPVVQNMPFTELHRYIESIIADYRGYPDQDTLLEHLVVAYNALLLVPSTQSLTLEQVIERVTRPPLHWPPVLHH